MRYLIELYLKYRFWLIFIALEVVSLVSLVKFNRYQGSVYFTTANTVSGAWYSFTSSISSFFELRSENERLEHENEMLRKRLNDLRSGLKEDENTIDLLSEKNRDLRSYDFELRNCPDMGLLALPPWPLWMGLTAGRPGRSTQV